MEVLKLQEIEIADQISFYYDTQKSFDDDKYVYFPISKTKQMETNKLHKQKDIFYNYKRTK